MNALYRLQEVSYSYLGRYPALNSVNMEIEEKKRVALIGANGSGKSTLLKLLDALYFPQAGVIEFDGQSLTEAKFQDEEFALSFRRRVGFVFQDPEVQLFCPTVADEICFGPLQLGWAKDVVRSRLELTLKQFGLDRIRNRAPIRLSIGEKKKVALASVLILDPDVLLLDEPTASLDPRTQSLLLELLQEWGSGKKTIVTSTHDLTILREICDEVYVMQDGAVIVRDHPETVLEDEELLDRTNLIHVHTHRHPQVQHAHPHTHDFHAHSHDEE